MRRIFIDAAFLIALLNDRDELHALALMCVEEFFDAPGVDLYTSDAVLAEVLTHFSRSTETSRRVVVDMTRRLRAEK